MNKINVCYIGIAWRYIFKVMWLNLGNLAAVTYMHLKAYD